MCNKELILCNMSKQTPQNREVLWVSGFDLIISILLDKKSSRVHDLVSYESPHLQLGYVGVLIPQRYRAETRCLFLLKKGPPKTDQLFHIPVYHLLNLFTGAGP